MRGTSRVRPAGGRVLTVASILAFGAVACSATSSTAHRAGRSPAPPTASSTAPANFDHPLTASALQPGSDPSVLPGPVLIADRSNNRLVVVNQRGQVTWEFPEPGDLLPGQTFQFPDDAFFSPDGREIVVTQEDDAVLSVIDVATRHIVYRYGTPGEPGSGPGHLSNPDDAQKLPNGSILVADIKNCRLVLLNPPSELITHVFGETTTACLHDPPGRWGSPNGAFPMANGHYVVTEINGDWIDELALDGSVTNQVHPPGVNYPSDTNEVHPGLFVTVDYSSPGTLETFTAAGQLVWRYQPRPGDAMLDHPSLATPLPNGDFLMNDDDNNRVVAIDPHTNSVVCQYGVTGRAGNALGLLNDPDGVDLVPPYSLDIVATRSAGQH